MRYVVLALVIALCACGEKKEGPSTPAPAADVRVSGWLACGGEYGTARLKNYGDKRADDVRFKTTCDYTGQWMISEPGDIEPGEVVSATAVACTGCPSVSWIHWD